MACVIFSAHYKPISTAFSPKNDHFQPRSLSNQQERGQGRGGSRANGEEILGLEGLGWEGWRVVVVLGGREWGKTQYQKAQEFPPQWP